MRQFIVFALIALAGIGQVFAQSTSAQSGVVVAVAAAPATQAQQQYGSYGYQNAVYTPPPAQSYAGTAGGSVIGAAVGALAGRHMRGGGQWAASGLAGAIGGLIGHMADQRSNERAEQAAQAQQVAQQQASTGYGQQVIVRLDGGQTVALFSRASGLMPGQKVWIIGGQEIIPAG